MSTVAFKDGILAADTLIVSGADSFSGHISKIAKCADFMGGACGDLSSMSIFLKWITSGADTRAFPNVSSHLRAILIDKKGKVYYVNKDGLSGPVDNPFFAIGSGEDVAKGAFIAGATAAEAVQAAISVDIYTGGSVETLHL